MSAQALQVLREFSNLTSRISSEVLDEKLVDRIADFVFELEKISSIAKPVVLWVDNRKALQLPAESDLTLLPVQFKKNECAEFPPMHNYWIYCCSNIESYAASTVDTLTWLQKTGQMGSIIVYGADDIAQRKKIKLSMQRMIGTQVHFTFVDEPGAIGDVLPGELELRNLQTKTADRFLTVFSKSISEAMDALLAKILNNCNSLDSIYSLLRTKIEDFELSSDNFASSRTQLIESLKEEIPDFSWLEVLSNLTPEIETILSTNEENQEEENEPDDADIGEATVENFDSDRIVSALNGEVKRCITESLEAISIRYVTDEDIRSIENDSTIFSALKRIMIFLNKPQTSFSIQNNPAPEWPMNSDYFSSTIDYVLSINPPPNKMIIKLVGILGKIKISKHTTIIILLEGVSVLLDKWATQVYLAVIDEVSKSLKAFESQNKLPKIQSDSAWHQYRQRMSSDSYSGSRA